MRRTLVVAFALGVAGCSSTQTGTIPQLAGQFARTHSGVGDTILHTFTNTPDGAGAYSALIDVRGTLYGTTVNGGTNGYGVVFQITASGKETVLHSFGGGATDGAFPYGALIERNGRLYGTTSNGGGSGCYSLGCGTIFKITKSGKESIIYRFKGGSGDGAFPEAGLTYLNGTFFGTTSSGGTANSGTLFKLRGSGTDLVLHSFAGGDDGAMPVAGLTNLNGMLYGTTELGGSGSCNGILGPGCGIVFKFRTEGTESTLYTFRGKSSNGEFPFAALTVVNGLLYGTTLNGGTSNIGTVFKITPSGKETVLYSFKNSAGDGNEPASSLLDVNGTLYGTTTQGGSASVGTVYEITTTGQETLLYSFAGYPTDGWQPTGGVISAGGKLFGTTNLGGSSTSCYGNFGPTGCGIVYSLSL
jgi:uncharacterized repeat protein (TIGR03803 family)